MKDTLQVNKIEDVGTLTSIHQDVGSRNREKSANCLLFQGSTVHTEAKSSFVFKGTGTTQEDVIGRMRPSSRSFWTAFSNFSLRYGGCTGVRIREKVNSMVDISSVWKQFSQRDKRELSQHVNVGAFSSFFEAHMSRRLSSREAQDVALGVFLLDDSKLFH